MNSTNQQNGMIRLWLYMLSITLVTLLLVYYIIRMEVGNTNSFILTVRTLLASVLPNFITTIASVLIIYFLFLRFDIHPTLTNPNNNPSLNYMLYGLKKQTRCENIYQSFELNRPQGNVNPIQWLWADSSNGNSIIARVMRNGFSSLKIVFNNKGLEGYGCNLAIRPEREMVLELPKGTRFLKFEAKVNQDSPTTEVALTVRLVNDYLQHWEYSSYPNNPIIFHIQGSEWNQCNIDLMQKDWWHLFLPDGNSSSGPSQPTFNLIASMILGVGAFKEGTIYPHEGQGVIEIRSIMVTP